jgi:hypothetical protein
MYAYSGLCLGRKEVNGFLEARKKLVGKVQHGLIIENKHRIRHLNLNATKEVMMTQPT